MNINFKTKGNLLQLITISICILITYKPIFAQKYFKTDSLFDAGNYEMCIQKQSKVDDNSVLIKALCYTKLGKFTEAEEFLNANTFKNENFLAGKYLVVGEINSAKGFYDEALTTLNKAEKWILQCKDEYQISEYYNQIGLANWGLNNLEKASLFLEKAKNIREKKWGQKHPYTASIYNNLGLINTENPDIQYHYFKKYITAFHLKYGFQHTAIAIGYNNLALVFLSDKQLDSAKYFLQKSLDIRIQLYGNQHTGVAFCYQSLAMIEAETGNNKVAKELLYKSLEIYNQIFKEKHSEKSTVYNQLATIALENEEFNEAEKLIKLSFKNNCSIYSDSLLIPKALLCNNTEIMLMSLYTLSNCYSDKYTKKTLRIKHLKKALLILNLADTLITEAQKEKAENKDKLKLANLAASIYENAIYVCATLAEVTHLEKYKNLAFYYAEKNKANVLLGAITETSAIEYAGIPSTLILQETKYKNSLSYYEQLYFAKNFPKYNDSILHYKNLIEKFTQNLEKQYPAYYNLKYNVKINSVTEISSVLKPNENVVSFTLLPRLQKLYVFVIQPNRKLKMYDYYLDNRFDKNITALRNAIKFNNEATFLKISSLIKKQIWQFSLSKKCKNLIVIPDGSLHQLPFEVLNFNKKAQNYTQASYLLQKYAISYQFSTSMFVQMRKMEANNKIDKLLACNPVKFNSNTNLSSREGLSDLLGTIEEVKDIEKFANKAGIQTTFLSETKASEAAFKNTKLTDYQIIHIASHGDVNLQNPQLSKIYFTDDTTNKNDGALTAAEIYNLKLKCELFTLSACETGRGKIEKGEGVIGLTRALIYAGAKNALVSYWKVDDMATAQLMSNFYESWLTSNNSGISTSLQQAKLSLIQNKQFIAPQFWAAFFLIGK